MTTVRQLSLKVSNVNKNLHVVVKLVYSKTIQTHHGIQEDIYLYNQNWKSYIIPSLSISPSASIDNSYYHLQNKFCAGFLLVLVHTSHSPEKVTPTSNHIIRSYWETGNMYTRHDAKIYELISLLNWISIYVQDNVTITIKNKIMAIGK